MSLEADPDAIEAMSPRLKRREPERVERLLQPYVVMRGLAEGAVAPEALR